MSVLDTIIGLIAPHSCLDCRQEGSLLCAVCTVKVSRSPLVCGRCDLPLTLHRRCKDENLRVVLSAVAYEGVAKALVRSLKFEAKLAAADPMAQLLAPLARRLPQDAVLIPVPTAPLRRRQRGYDQAVVLANRLSKLSGQLVFPALKRLGKTRQVGANRQQRLEQLAGKFRTDLPRELRSRPIILIDDVMTTGATLEAAAAALRSAGAEKVAALVFARATETESLGK